MKQFFRLFFLTLLLFSFLVPVNAVEPPQIPNRPSQPSTPAATPEAPNRPEFPPLERIEFVHRPRRESPQPTSAPLVVSGCPNPDGCNEYSLSKYKWIDPNGADDAGIAYLINTAAMPASVGSDAFEGILSSSFGIWHSANTSGKLKYRSNGTTTRNPGVQDFVNTIGFADLSRQYPGALAVTTVWYRTDTRSIVEFDMRFATGVPWRVNQMPTGCTEYPINTCIGDQSAYDVQNVAVHEIGHTLMLLDLGKSRQRELTMYGFARLGELKKRTLGLGDRTAVNAMYP